MTDWMRILLAVAPRGKPPVRDGMAASMDACVEHADISSKLRQAHFMSQCAHESAGFLTTVEYASGAAYEGRKDLGNTQHGDGSRYKGRGPFMLTGRSNYREYGNVLGVPLETSPEQAAVFPVAAMIAAEFWKRKKCNEQADLDNIIGVTRKINGGTNGLASRQQYLARAKHALSDLKGALVARASEETATAAQHATVATKTAGAAAVTQAAHAAPQTNVWVIVAIGAVIAAVAVAAWLKSRKASAVAAVLTQAAKEV